ncbi:urea carboxylase [Lachnospiraceae bacterium]|uniref:5-oxoprolinase subunit C family protein n=1 Tax=Extibacter sp. GGCC_0201 TaxID=2731209 RepID=UPI001AA1377E|nr:biotin-dependent carboxyltransferase family protein [Extibacter sp. GGCC_0201]MBO1720939.1 biotin-dependent carboxyltransferase family protein [Extibacter sp. GGCC_0201]BDF32001.1 urea carboxylase [Lachnospiraceae bacterium]BDF36014.1 urea carboxylase [Lachnospiraceae bacterium]
MAVKITMPGAFTTVQDAGRYGYQCYGIGPSGVMDEKAYADANYLVGNENKEAVLETALYGGEMEITEDTVLAVTGADMEPKRNGELVPMNEPVRMKAGDTLSLGAAREGCRTYIAFAGGIDVPVVMGSRSTSIRYKLGGYEGRALKAGDELPFGKGRSFEEVKGRKTEGREFPSELCIRVIPGPQDDYFTEKGKATFYSAIYTVSEQSDRMGCRLDGPGIESREGTDIVSDAIPCGSVQVPADGRPIVLMADRQTTGGYAKIATVCAFDIPKLAQGMPGDRVRFTAVSRAEADRINRKQVRK